MNKLLEQAVTAAACLSDESQSMLARQIMDEAKRLAILEAIADADADGSEGVPHQDVCKWVESWGTEHELSEPQCK